MSYTVKIILYLFVMIWITIFDLAWYFSPQDTNPLPVAFIEISILALIMAWIEMVLILKHAFKYEMG